MKELDLPDGMPVLNIIDAVLTGEGYEYVIRGPMVDVDLEDEEISKCPEASEMLRLGVSGEYKSLLNLHDASKEVGIKTGPLDSVSIKVHLENWRKRGAVIGKIQNGAIVWDA